MFTDPDENTGKDQSDPDREAKRKAARELAQVIGPRVREQRELSQKTQNEAAEGVGMSREGIANIEGGHSLPTSETLYKISRLFGVPMEYFITGKYPSYHHPGLKGVIEELRELTERLGCLEHDILEAMGDQSADQSNNSNQGKLHGNPLESQLLSGDQSAAPGFSDERNSKKNPEEGESEDDNPKYA